MLAQLPAEITSPVDPAYSSDLVGTLVSRVLTYAIAFSGLYFFIRLVIAGFTYLTSFGDPAKAAAASQTIQHAAIGLVIVISAFFIAQIVSTVTGVRLNFV